MPTTAVRVLGGLDIASVCGFSRRQRAVLLSDGAVLQVGAHPLFEVTMQLAAGDSTLTAVHLALDAHALEIVSVLLESLRGRCSGVAVNEGTGEPPCPFQVVGPVAPGRERHRTVHTSVDIVEVAVGQAETGAVDGVEVIEDGVV